MKLSESEIKALMVLKAKGMIPISTISDKTTNDHLGDVKMPGMRVLKKLEKAGLCIIQNEDDAEEWEPYVFLTEEGEKFLTKGVLL